MTAYTGAAVLLRAGLRQDRRRLVIWAAALGLMVIYSTQALNKLYPTAADRQVRAALISSPAAVMLTGPGYGVERYTLGAMIANELVLTLVIASSIMSSFMVIRHTRAQEEDGAAELVRAAPVGRRAPLTAALLLTLVANLAIGVLELIGLVAGGLAITDSFVLISGMVLTGMVFAAVGAVAAQVTAGARTANGLALAVLGVVFVLRAVGDAAHRHGSPLSWFSPLAWVQQTRAFVDLRTWPLLLTVGLIGLLVALAYVLLPLRDLGGGFVADRPGRPHAAMSLAGPFGLAVRQQRGTVVAWAVALALMAVATGSLTKSINDSLGASAKLLQTLNIDPSRIQDGFLSRMTALLAFSIGAFAVGSVTRARSEEVAGRAENVLTAAVSRWRFLGGTLLLAVLASAALLLLSGLSVALGVGAALGDWSKTGELVGASLAQLPAVAVLAGLAVALVGVAPRLTGLVWVIVAYAVLVGFFGPLLQLPRWSYRLSPFDPVPDVLLASWRWTPEVLLVLAAAALAFLGLVAFRRRDLATG